MSLNVLKVGGIIFRSPQGFYSLRKILSNTQIPAFIVISAIDKTSRNLRMCLHLAAIENFKQAIQTLDSIFEMHLSIAAEILNNQSFSSYEKFLFTKQSSISETLKGISLIADFSPRIADKVMAEGENIALELVYLYLSECNFDTTKVLSEHHIITDKKHQFAIPFKDNSIINLRNSINKLSTELFLIQGFSGISIENRITTMGFESSNLTACLVAAASETDNLTIWTDVAGIYSVDPKLGNSPKHNYISIRDAEVLAKHGLKIIYQPMLEYAEEFDFNISIKNAFKPEESGTVISKNAPKVKTPFIISDEKSSSDDFYNISICFISNTQSIKLLTELTKEEYVPQEYNYSEDNLYLSFSKNKNSLSNIIKVIGAILF